jgi:DNA-binding CsgD family transcriptional regulator
VRAFARGAPEAAALAFERAAALSDRAARRAGRLVAAADAAWTAGRADRVTSLLDQAGPLAADSHTRARSAFVRARHETRRGDVAAALKLVLASCAAAVHDAPDLALDMLLEGLLATVYSGDVTGFANIGRLAGELADSGRDGHEFFKNVLVGVGLLFGANPQEGIARLKAAGQPPRTVTGLLYAGHAAAYGGDPGWGDAYGQAVDLARETGAVGDLPYALNQLAGAHRFRGDLVTAEIVATEGLALAEETGQDADGCLLAAELAMIAAIRGDEDTCHVYADRALATAVGRGITLAAAMATWSLGLLELGGGRPDEALIRLRAIRDPANRVANMTVAMFSSADLVEAAYRCGRSELAADALASIEGWARSGMGYARVAAARSRGMLADHDGWEEHYLAALAVDAPEVPDFELARAELAYGEALRRGRRPAQAREPLRSAIDRFDRLGAAAWADRARTELRASGQTVRARSDPAAVATLTAQELQIARMVASGASNQAVAAALFLSPRTVEYHLYKAYPKLGISSRAELPALV